MLLNSHILKLTGSAEMSGPLELGKRYAVGIEVGITDERKVDNEDQTFNLEYKAKLIRAEIKTDLGLIKTKDKTRESVKTRYAILACKNEVAPEMDDEQFYALVQKTIRMHLPETMNLLKPFLTL
jgi:hypothetical protein